LARAMERWTGESRVLVDLEGHGREEIDARVDVSRTVGWFTSMYPVELKLGGGAVGEELKRIKEQLRAVPGRGLGYGILRYLGRSDLQERLKRLPAAEISFNYLGQFDHVLGAEGMLGPAGESRGESFSGTAARKHLLSVNSAVAGERLQVSWSYSENRHERETIEKLAESYVAELQRIITHCESPEAGGYTPSDFPLVKLDQEKFGKLSTLIEKLDQSKTSP
jgi:non-ribosomal peptide synthase protein (TIGR01720 family)